MTHGVLSAMSHFVLKMSFSSNISIPENSKGIQNRLFLLLRIGMTGCFIGHGIWGLIGKSGWLPFFHVFFISDDAASFMMPVIGVMDILIGILAWFRPTRALLFWATFWTLFTAALRPSAGLGMSEFFERAGNYMIPLAFLFVTQSFTNRSKAFAILKASDIDVENNMRGFELTVRLGIALLLVGHGGLAFFNDHAILTKHAAFLGIENHQSVLKYFGLVEFILGFTVFFAPRLPGLIPFVLIFKIAVELLHPIAGNSLDILETIERMGDYILPLILVFLYKYSSKTSSGLAVSAV